MTFEPAVAVPGEEEVVPVSAAQLQQYLSYFGRSTVATLANATGPPWEVEALAALAPEKAARDGLFLSACAASTPRTPPSARAKSPSSCPGARRWTTAR